MQQRKKGTREIMPSVEKDMKCRKRWIQRMEHSGGDELLRKEKE